MEFNITKAITYRPTRDSWEEDDHEHVLLVLPTLDCLVLGSVADWVSELDTQVSTTASPLI